MVEKYRVGVIGTNVSKKISLPSSGFLGVIGYRRGSIPENKVLLP
jgi:hypothetical protein